jgi:hypothetical protein
MKERPASEDGSWMWAPPPLRFAAQGLRCAAAALARDGMSAREVREVIRKKVRPADSGWLTSVSKIMALENGILPWGKDAR